MNKKKNENKQKPGLRRHDTRTLDLKKKDLLTQRTEQVNRIDSIFGFRTIKQRSLFVYVTDQEFRSITKKMVCD